MNRFPQPHPINHDGLVLKNVRCIKCGKLQWSYGNCRFCHGTVRDAIR